MNSASPLLQEVRELRLLIDGLSRVASFPSELLELMRTKLDRLERMLLSGTGEGAVAFVDPPAPEVKDALCKEELSMAVPSPPVVVPPVMVEPPKVDDSEMAAPAVDMGAAEQLDRIDISLTLNDRFLFQRELFENDSQRMAAFFRDLSQQTSKTEALNLLKAQCAGCEQTEGFETLTALLDQWFPSPTGQS